MNARAMPSPGRWLAGLVLAAPMLALALSLYGQHGMLFWDAKTIPCGVLSMLQTGNPNAYLDNPAYPGACAGYGWEYMLPPAATAFLAGFARLFGVELLNVLYFILYGLALVLLAKAARRHGAGKGELALFVAFLACGVFVYDLGGGNVSIAFLGLTLGLILTGERNSRWVPALVLLCVAVSFLKPIYALYLLVPLYAAGAWLAVSAAAAAITVGYALDAALQAEQFDRWLNFLVPVVYGQPHFGLMRLMEWIGVGPGDWLALGGAHALWCAAIAGLLWSARGRLESAEDRAFAALLAVTLMLPRLKEYDTVVLIPLVFWLRSRLPESRQALFQRLVVLLAFLAPALWWWIRKLGLLVAVAEPTLTQIADPRWHISTQGYFLTALLALCFGFLVWPGKGGSRPMAPRTFSS